jgi:hypothetical protein
MGLFLLTIVAIIQSRGGPEEQPVGGRSPHRHNGRSSGPGTPVRRSASRRLYDSPSAALLPESFMSPEAAELQESQPDDELAGHLVKARRKSEVADEADLDEGLLSLFLPRSCLYGEYPYEQQIKENNDRTPSSERRPHGR